MVETIEMMGTAGISLYVLISSSYEDTSQIGLVCITTALFYDTYLCKGPTSKQAHSEVLRLGLQHMNLRSGAQFSL